MIVSEIIKHLKNYKFINIIFIIIFVFICIFSFISKKDNLVSQTNIYARSNLFYSEIVNQNKKLIINNLFGTYEGSNDQSIDTQYADTLLHIRKIDIQGEVVKDFETMMKSKFLVPLFLGYLRDRVEFNHFLKINPISSQIIDHIGQDLSQKYKDQKMSKYDVFYNKILKINSDKEFLKLTFNGKSNDDILKLQKSFTEFFLNNFDDRLQEIVVLRNSNSNLNINEELFYTESSKFTSSLIFTKIPFIILSFLIFLFLIISINFFLYFFKR